MIGVLLCGLLTAGLGAAGGLTSASGGSEELAFQTTVEKLVTVREQGRIVQKFVPVAVKAVEPGQRRESGRLTELKYVTRVVSRAGDSSVHPARKLVLVATTRQITIDRKPQTVIRTRLDPRTRTETAAVTRTVTNTQNVTQPPETVTEAQTNTLTRTETRVQTATRVETQTLTETRVETVTLPPQTVTVLETVTVTVPKPK
jgi:hypothetical protein